MSTDITRITDTKKDSASIYHQTKPYSRVNSRKLGDETIPWTTAKIKDELVTELALATVYVMNEQYGCTYILFKYYEKAAYWMYRIPVYRPPPIFDIDLRDLSTKLRHELAELKKSDGGMFCYVIKTAVAHIFENINFEYFHRSVMRHLKITFICTSSEVEKNN